MKADQILRAGLDTLVQRGVKRDQPDGAADDLDGERRVEGVESMNTSITWTNGAQEMSTKERSGRNGP